MRISFYRILVIAISLSCSIFGQNPKIEQLKYNTRFGQVVTYKREGGSTPAYISLGGNIIFTSPANEGHIYGNILEAGFLYPTSGIQYSSEKPPAVLRWIIKVWGPALADAYYIVDLTNKKPRIVGPFASDTNLVGDDDVIAISWKKHYAQIKFKSNTIFTYSYQGGNVFEDIN